MSNREKSEQYRQEYSNWIFPIHRQVYQYRTKNRNIRQQLIPPEQYSTFNETIFKEKFFDAYREKEKAFQAITFFANQDLQNRYSLAELQKIPIEEQLNNIKKLTYEKWLQFYRFSVINDDPSAFFPLFSSEQLNTFHQNFTQNWENILNSNAMEKNKFGIFFEHDYTIKNENEDENEARHYDPDDFRKNTWAKDLNFILSQLKKMGKEDPLLYYEKWLQAKRARAEKRNLPTELKKLEIVENSFKRRKEKIKENQQIETAR